MNPQHASRGLKTLARRLAAEHAPVDAVLAGSCSTCRFGGGPYSDGWDTGLRCRRRPPVVVGGTTESIKTVWPLVDPDDWCGEFLPVLPA